MRLFTISIKCWSVTGRSLCLFSSVTSMNFRCRSLLENMHLTDPQLKYRYLKGEVFYGVGQFGCEIYIKEFKNSVMEYKHCKIHVLRNVQSGSPRFMLENYGLYSLCNVLFTKYICVYV
jgi:hypothetical protein